MASHWQFIGNVFAHLVALMSGIASFIIATLSAIKKRPLVERWFWIAGGLCLMAAVDGAWQDEHRNSEALKLEKAAEVATVNSCLQDARVEHALTVGLQGLTQSQRESIDSKRAMNGKQQADVNACVISLGKMNPLITRKIDVITFQIATTDATGKLVGRFAPRKLYVFALLVTINGVGVSPNGTLQCQQDFSVTTVPSLYSTTPSMIGSFPPETISGKEYEVRVQNTGRHGGLIPRST